MRTLVALIAFCAALLAASIVQAETGITDRLARMGTAIKVTSEPAGTTSIRVAVMRDMAGDGREHLNLPASQLIYTPPPATPVVEVRAYGVEGPIGGWTQPLQTTPSP